MHSDPQPLTPGVYERLMDQELAEALAAHPDLPPVLGKLDDEDSPESYSQFVLQVLRSALRGVPAEQRLGLVNRLLDLLAATDGLDYLQRRRLLASPEPLLLAVRPAGAAPPRRPLTPLSTSSLLTGARGDPALEHELRNEMATADRVDILVSFIKWSGLRLLAPAFEDLAQRSVPVRIATTSYMGASDPEAVTWLARQPGFQVRVSYDTTRTRLHAKAYHFHRSSGFSAAYIGSANLSQAAMTSGLEWTVKVTEADQPHILQRFSAEFDAYWESADFESFTPSEEKRLRDAIRGAKEGSGTPGTRFFADLQPRPFQARILEALEAARECGQHRNLVVAATGTGKTVIAAIDYRRHVQATRDPKVPLLFVAHRREILEQARDCFRHALRDANFGELWVDGERPAEALHLFASVQSLASAPPWSRWEPTRFPFVVIDEVHHAPAQSYRAIFNALRPRVLLGLTATPERMDGDSILPDFGGRPAAEIRLPEALEEKLLCPFHYFGVTDPVSLTDDRFWRNGRYDTEALTDAYTGDDLRARQRLDAVFTALARYQPDLRGVRAVGFCASVRHARFMAEAFRLRGHDTAVIVGDTPSDERARRVAEFRAGTLPFVFTVDVFSEGVDVPEINLVLFLRPTESLTVFLQQLGRGLRHSPGKDCLTVLDFVGQCHRRYQIARKFSALLTRDRLRIDAEAEQGFPHLPPGCNIQLERVARDHVLENIRESLRSLATLVTEITATLTRRNGRAPVFGEVVRHVGEAGFSALDLLRNRSWSEWKALANSGPSPEDPDARLCLQALRRVLLRTDPQALRELETFARNDRADDAVTSVSAGNRLRMHYLLWGRQAEPEVATVEASLARWHANTAARRDLEEIVTWRLSEQAFPTREIALPFPCSLRLHAAYGTAEIKAALGLSSLERPGPTGVGVLPVESLRCYVHLVTFRKSERDFSPTTRYRDYPISPTRLHWESQSGTSRRSPVGQDYLHFHERGCTVLFFARLEKRIEGETAPFIFLGPASRLISADGDRPITMVWDLAHPMPAALFEEARPA